MRLRLVSDFFADSIQQIHSLRASGVMSSQVAKASGSRSSASPRSLGRLWTAPPGMLFSSVISYHYVYGAPPAKADPAYATRDQLGGTVEATNAGLADSWQKTTVFLAKALASQT